MNGVTRDVEPATLRELFEQPPRATVAFVDGETIEVLPACVAGRVDRPRFAVACAGEDLSGREVVLVVDDGPYWFDLRGISLRGTARTDVAAPRNEALRWYELEPHRVLAWDYESLRPALQ